MTTPLPAISALARAGAVERASELFVAEGYGARTQDPAAQAVLGRLLKARARQAAGPDQTALLKQAAAAYAAAHALAPAPYLAINTATLCLLAGDRTQAQDGARAVLALLAAAPPPSDTPYFLAATKAEALLLLDDPAGAEQAMEQAVAHDPDGWSDRAATIAQLTEILARNGGSAAWLDRFAPPASLHFAGHMGLAAGGAGEAGLAEQVDALIAQERIGFAWGALAAGSDVVIAERLLASGAELHVVLPCDPDQFAAQSVAPAGPDWLARYHTVLDLAASLQLAAADPGAVHDPLATAHAGELAIGGAMIGARHLAARCCQLIVADADGGGRNTARQAAMWPKNAGPQHRLIVPRDAQIEALFPAEQHDPARALAVHVAIQIDELTRPARLDTATITALTEPVARALARLDRRRVRAAPGRWELVLDDPHDALTVMLEVLERSRTAGLPGPSLGAHIAISTLLGDPAGDVLIPYGPGIPLARRLQAMAPPGLALISDALAVTLVARGITGLRSELYHRGDADSEGAVHVLLRAGQ